jgi:hypothetical protein
VCDVYEDCIGSDTAHLDCQNLPINVFGDLPPEAAKTVIASASAMGRVQWNPTGAKACYDMLTTQGCGLFKNDGNPLALCAAIAGSVNNGALCQNDIECATPGAQCVERMPGATNQCTEYICQAPVPAGMPCHQSGDIFCRTQDHCVNRNQGGTDISFCATGEPGQACDSSRDCDVGNFCNGGQDNGTAAGVCTASKPAGSTCLDDDECQGELACVGNFGTVNGTCRDVRAADAVCDSNNFAYSCHGHQACETQGANMTGMCKPAADLGQACNVLNGTPGWCGLFMSCEGGLCREPGAIGDPCSQSNVFGFGSASPNGCNAGLFCDVDITGQLSGTCRGPQADGAMCSRESHCASQYCNDVTMRCEAFPVCTF